MRHADHDIIANATANREAILSQHSITPEQLRDFHDELEALGVLVPVREIPLADGTRAVRYEFKLDAAIRLLAQQDGADAVPPGH